MWRWKYNNPDCKTLCSYCVRTYRKLKRRVTSPEGQSPSPQVALEWSAVGRRHAGPTPYSPTGLRAQHLPQHFCWRRSHFKTRDQMAREAKCLLITLKNLEDYPPPQNNTSVNFKATDWCQLVNMFYKPWMYFEFYKEVAS